MLGYLLSMHFNVLSSKPVRKKTDPPKRGTGLVTWQSRACKVWLLKEVNERVVSNRRRKDKTKVLRQSLNLMMPYVTVIINLTLLKCFVLHHIL